MRLKITVLIFILNFIYGGIHCQTIFKSNKGYTIEIPKGYTKKEGIGKNVDLKIIDNSGNTIVVVVKKLPADNEITSAYILDDMTNEQWENSLAEGLPNPKVVKKGKTYLDKKEAFYLHYRTTEYGNARVYYNINYQVILKNTQYVITATCLNENLTAEMPVFYRMIQSIKFY